MTSRKQKKRNRKRVERTSSGHASFQDEVAPSANTPAETPDRDHRSNDGRPYPARKIYTDSHLFKTFQKLEKEFGVNCTFLEFFTQPSKSSTPCWVAETIQGFCENGENSPTPSAPVTLQLHDRERRTNKSRDYPRLLSPDQMRKALEVPRFGEKNLPNVHRRQILIKNLDAASVHTLAETAACHQVDTLRDAMYKHISGATSIKVQKQKYGPNTPHLELHLPYLALRANTQNFEATKSCEDFFVPNFASSGKQLGPYVIHEAHISIVLCVWDRSNWVAYAFSKPCSGDAPERVSAHDEEQDESDSDEEEDFDYPTDDIFAPDNGQVNLNSERTIWNPRSYFLHIAAIWIVVVHEEYAFLVLTLEASVKTWVREQSTRCVSILTFSLRRQQPERML
jgi:hypothetical protein